MTWGFTRLENVESGSIGPVAPYSTHNHPLSPASYDYYSYEKGYYQQVYDPRYVARSYSYDHYVGFDEETRTDYHHSTSKSRGPSSLYQPPPLSSSFAPGAPPYPWSYHFETRDLQSSGHIPTKNHLSSGSTEPTSPLPRGALPPGRHQFSPAGYRSDPPEHEQSQRYEEYQAYPPRYLHKSWSPVHAERSPIWKSPYGGQRYAAPTPPGHATSFAESVNTSHSSNLSVPSLGVENRPYGSVDVPVLSPWSRSSCGDTPPRRPASARDFAPPASKSRQRMIRRRETYTQPWEAFTSTPGEEKKIDDDTVSDIHAERAPLPCKSSPPTPLEDTKTTAYVPPNKPESINGDAESLEDAMAIDMGSGLFGRTAGKADSVRSSPALTIRSSPLLARISIVATDGDYAEHAEDIEMSPISQAYHEDPSTLMELPDNLMTLPISPCGPHDYPHS
jgi:hypothetical protein